MVPVPTYVFFVYSHFFFCTVFRVNIPVLYNVHSTGNRYKSNERNSFENFASKYSIDHRL
jgi:hypothetical protein